MIPSWLMFRVAAPHPQYHDATTKTMPLTAAGIRNLVSTRLPFPIVCMYAVVFAKSKCDHFRILQQSKSMRVGENPGNPTFDFLLF
jgi:hypothetical protein